MRGRGRVVAYRSDGFPLESEARGLQDQRPAKLLWRNWDLLYRLSSRVTPHDQCVVFSSSSLTIPKRPGHAFLVLLLSHSSFFQIPRFRVFLFM